MMVAETVKEDETYTALVQACMIRDWGVLNFFPVKGFLKPAAYDCGSLEEFSRSSVATSEYSSSSEEGSPRPAAIKDLKGWTPTKP